MKKDHHHESKENISQIRANDKFEEFKFLWEEYKYRHELCWKLIFQITAAVVIILIIPYTQPKIAGAIKYWIVTLPAIAIILLIFSFIRLSKELGLLHKIRTKYRELQNQVYNIIHCPEDDTFKYHVNLYLIGLTLACIADVIAIIFFWIPYLISNPAYLKP